MYFIGDIFWAIDWALSILGLLLGLWVFLDVASRRADAFTAADRLSKPAWLGISGGCAFVLALYILFGIVPPQQILWLAAMIGVLVYLVDVRPRLKDVQNGSRW